jgi:hypothetical protein
MSLATRWFRQHRRSFVWASVVALIAVVVFLVIGFWECIPASFGNSTQTPLTEQNCLPGCASAQIGSQYLPSGVTVTLSWSAGGQVHFWMAEPAPTFPGGGVPSGSQTILCSGLATVGTCAFHSVGATYGFYASTGTNSSVPIVYQGSYETTLLGGGPL